MADIKESFSKGLTALNVKTSSFLEVKKMQTYITTLNLEIEGLEKEIGRSIYENWKASGELSVSLVQEQLSMIEQKKQTIAEQTKGIEELAKKEQEILGTGETAKTGKIFCSNCGQRYETLAKFCKKCGTKLQP